MSTTKTELDRSIYSYYHHWDSVSPFRFIKERPHSAWLRYFSVTIAGHEFHFSAKQRLFLQRDPELKSFSLIDRLYFSHFINFYGKIRTQLLDVLVIICLFSKRQNSYIGCPFFSARSLAVNVEEKTSYNNSVEGALPCHDYLVHFGSFTFPYALWNLTLTKKLLVKDKVAGSCATNTLPSIISNVTNNKNELWKTVGLPIFQKPTLSIRFNLLRVCPSESSFIIAVLLVHSFIMFLVFIFIVFHWTQFAQCSI